MLNFWLPTIKIQSDNVIQCTCINHQQRILLAVICFYFKFLTDCFCISPYPSYWKPHCQHAIRALQSPLPSPPNSTHPPSFNVFTALLFGKFRPSWPLHDLAKQNPALNVLFCHIHHFILPYTSLHFAIYITSFCHIHSLQFAIYITSFCHIHHLILPYTSLHFAIYFTSFCHIHNFIFSLCSF